MARGFNPELERKIQTLPIHYYRLVKIPFLFLTWLLLALIILSSDNLMIRGLSIFMISCTFHTLGIFTHDAGHASLTGHKIIDRCIGLICGIAMFLPCSNFRIRHLRHHAHLHSSQDPDLFYKYIDNKILQFLFLILLAMAGTFLYNVVAIFNSPIYVSSKKEKAICLGETLFLILFYAGLAWMIQAHHLWSQAFQLWLLPYFITQWSSNLRAFFEHIQWPIDNSTRSIGITRSIASNPFVRFVLNNQNYHFEHHLFPKLPWYHLPTAHALLSSQYDKDVARSYKHYQDVPIDSFVKTSLKAIER